MSLKAPPPNTAPALQDKAFLLLVLVISLAFAWIIWPFYGAVFWATVLAILFAPLYRRLSVSFGRRPTLAALATIVIILVLVFLPLAALGGMLLQEAIAVYERIKSGDLNFAAYLQQIMGAMPAWMTSLLARLGLADFADLQERLSGSLMKTIQFLSVHAFSAGQSTFDFIVNFFIMLYLLFFLLREGEAISRRIGTAVPLDTGLQRNLSRKFTNVVRATVKGNVVIAILQGMLGGLIFWLLDIHAPVFWAVVMAFLSLLPAVGTALVWGPVAIYFLVTGAVVPGIALTAYGVLVIGLVDNVLRPILVGQQTKIPDYVILISTLGGMVIFGINGFVIGPLIAAMFIAVWDVVAASKAGATVRGE